MKREENPLTAATYCVGLSRASAAEPRDLENPYNSRVLVYNWYEDRRQYRQDCTRCTGNTITRTDFIPHNAEDYRKDKCIPPKQYEIESKTAGVGSRLLLNDSNYCDYMQNYTTTYDLMHNWEVRRAGCKPKPNKRWKLIMDAIWQPQPDNAVSFGNLTTLGFRQSPQLPMVPNDWHTYQTDTSYRRQFSSKRYPDDFVLCRYASSKLNRQGTEDMLLTPKPGVCDCCRFKVRCDPSSCACSCHLDANPQRFPTLVPQHTLKSYLPRQNLHHAGITGNPAMKHEPHPRPVPGYPIYESTCPDPCDKKDFCRGLQDAERYRQGPPLDIGSNVC